MPSRPGRETLCFLATASTSAAPGTRRQTLARAAERLARQRHLLAVRDGVVSALPLVLVGSLFLLVAQPPWPALQRLLAPYSTTLLLPYRALGGCIALWVTFGTAQALARSYALDTTAAGLIAASGYVLAALQPGAPAQPLSLLVARLGAGGIFAGLLLAIASVELTRMLVARRWTLRLPGGPPEVVVRSFVALLPAALVLTGVFLVVHLAGLDLITLLERAVAPLVHAADSLGGVVTLVVLDSVLWFLGVHPAALTAAMRPVWEAMLVANMEAVATHAAPPHVAPLHFFLWFVWQGGSGAALALGLLLLRCRSAQLRAVGRAGIVPVLCNINEPLLFGVPVVLNPRLAPPFVLAPLLSAAVAWSAFRLGWVHPPYLETLWTLPAPVGAWLTTGGDPRAVVLQLGTLGLAIAVYWPFVRREDRRLATEEQTASRASLPPAAPTP
ncbi:MAG TPA: PTS transporter subunit EIIC [Myxococcaceae bacterium]|nr:PTS transporter subunit EIIC [Myxococcaceae bacterium]